MVRRIEGSPCYFVTEQHSVRGKVREPDRSGKGEAREPANFVEFEAEVVPKVYMAQCVVDAVRVEQSVDDIDVDIRVNSLVQGILHVGFGLGEHGAVRPGRVDRVGYIAEAQGEAVRKECIVENLKLMLEKRFLPSVSGVRLAYGGVL